MFIVALFTIPKKWNQLKHLSMNEWIKAIVYIHNEMLFGPKIWSLVICNSRGRTGGYWETSQEQKDKFHMISFICGI
jgi:hypothetical protein